MGEIVNMTSIVITVKSTMGADEISEILKEGIHFFRLNCAHLSKHEIMEKTNIIRDISAYLGAKASIFSDLPGIKARIWFSPCERISIVCGEQFTINNSTSPIDNGTFQIVGNELFSTIRKGDVLVVRRRGLLRLLVEESHENWVKVRALTEGVIGWGYQVVIEDKYVLAKDLSDLDKAILQTVIESKPDFICASFADTKEVMLHLRDLTYNSDYYPTLLAKIESPAAIRNLGEILAVSDGAIIGRDDLSMWLDNETLQKETYNIIKECKRRGLIAVPASNYFSSLCTSSEISEDNRKDIEGVLELNPDFLYCNETNRTNCYKNIISVVRAMGLNEI